jgi:parallel beta-helix repeat protein
MGDIKRLCAALAIFVLLSSFLVILTPKVKASPAEFPDLQYHGLADLFSSLTVVGTVVLYDHYNFSSSSHTISFTDTHIPNLIAYSRGSATWDNAIRSLKVEGTITLYEHPRYAGRKATFTSNSLPYDNIGTEWNQNSNLLKNESTWDQRTWHWSINPIMGTGLLDTYHGDKDNYVNWSSDGLVKSSARDGAGDPWKASNFDQGCERYENEISDLGDWNWNNRACSLRVEGSVTLFEGFGYSGANRTFTTDTNLASYGWVNITSSLRLSLGSRVTLYESNDFNNPQGKPSISFVCPSYQPPDLKVNDTETITLEGVVKEWWADSWAGGWPSWTGAKFDVFVVDDRYNRSGNVLMMEFYFLRMGGNLAWQVYPPYTGDRVFRHDNPNSYNYLVSLDCFPERVEREIYSGDKVKWRIDVKSFIQDACDYFPSLDINKLRIAKISFTLEAAWNLLSFNPGVGCTLTRLRLAYGTNVQAYLKIVNPITGNQSFSFTSAEKSVGDTFTINITAIDVTRLASWQVGLLWNSSLLTFDNVTIPPDSLFGSQSLIVAGPDTSTPGLMLYGAALSPSGVPVSGSGVLFQLILRITQSVNRTFPTIVHSGLDIYRPGTATFLSNDTLGDISFSPVSGNYDYKYARVIPETLRVPSEYPTIQYALDSAIDEDTIYVAPGTYYENLYVNKRVQIIGDDWRTTTIDGNYSGNVVLIIASNVTIQGFNLTHSGTGSSGLALYHVTNCNISGNALTNNGLGLYVENSSCNNIRHNDVKYNDYGIYLSQNASENRIYWNNFIFNGEHVHDQGWDDLGVVASVNYWNSSYPSGGNYWSNSSSVDLYNGPAQNETGSDAIGDTAHFIDLNNFDNYPLVKFYGSHDVGATVLNLSKTIVGKGYCLNSSLTVVNYSEETETFNTTLLANGTDVQTQSFSLLTRNSTEIPFMWNTTDFVYGNYTMSAYASPTPGEIDVTDNNCTSNVPVHVGVPGDVSGPKLEVYDGICNMRDVAYMVSLFNTRPDLRNWNPNADVNNDGVCNMKDIAIAILNFNKHE